MLNKKRLNQLKKYFADQPVDVVYLFGSQATQKATKLSDYDFGVLFKEGLNKSKRFDLKLEINADLCGILKAERVDVVDLGNAPLKFKYQVCFPKFVITNKNRDRLTKLEATTVKQYLDFRPFIYPIAKRQLEITAEKGFMND